MINTFIDNLFINNLETYTQFMTGLNANGLVDSEIDPREIFQLEKSIRSKFTKTLLESYDKELKKIEHNKNTTENNEQHGFFKKVFK